MGRVGSDSTFRQLKRKSFSSGDRRDRDLTTGSVILAMRKSARLGCSSKNGGLFSTISITMIPNDQMSALFPRNRVAHE